MANPIPTEPAPRLTLWADTAADLMTPNPISIREDATVREAIALLTDRGFSAAPVIDEAGRPVGVLSQSDILVHDRERSLTAVPEYYDRSELSRGMEGLAQGPGAGDIDVTRVRDIMTPVVFSVPPERPAAKVVEEMLALKVHRLFVVDRDGVLIGVISAHDILRRLRV
ncbi:MAG TPA: CBS domain-containing protein [Gemmataceae bacterium]|nr:CBS domain-containing protein [Gemmataceae bacterium]